MPTCWHCKAETTAAHYDRTVYNRHALHAEWAGWRMSGRFLVAPGKAGRLTPERLLGMLWEERARRSTEKNRTMASAEAAIVPFPNSPGKLPARERFDGQA